jgi:hypothetical protein
MIPWFLMAGNRGAQASGLELHPIPELAIGASSRPFQASSLESRFFGFYSTEPVKPN